MKSFYLAVLIALVALSVNAGTAKRPVDDYRDDFVRELKSLDSLQMSPSEAQKEVMSLFERYEVGSAHQRKLLFFNLNLGDMDFGETMLEALVFVIDLANDTLSQGDTGADTSESATVPNGGSSVVEETPAGPDTATNGAGLVIVSGPNGNAAPVQEEALPASDGNENGNGNDNGKDKDDKKGNKGKNKGGRNRRKRRLAPKGL
ncbi:expressed unknown protein [Seminavis robusta]|uniref:Uncharacterized protein n=1 Tax=Seminavis robusta TaxID=568900 RepID=A0A9N8HKK5_9STRA|nr:expressed unknown protein [Seminavis robusta]|eukprot:Sro847_g210260.1 n/a (204) ;mRNA; r:1024-1950